MAEVHAPHAPGEHAPTDNPEVHHELSDVNIRAILLFGAGLVASGIVISFLVWLLFGYFTRREARVPSMYPLAATEENRLPPEPRLQTNPRQDLRDLRTQEAATLNSYGWVDRNAGIVRIPVGDAMKLIVQRGLPARQERR